MTTPPKVRIALVDDDSDEKYIFSIALAELGIDYGFEYFENAEDFIVSLCENETTKPDIVFIDKYMPRRSGMELLEEIRKDKRFDNIQTIIYSSVLSELEIETIKSLEGNGFIVKPPDFGMLKESLKKLIVSKFDEIRKMTQA